VLRTLEDEYGVYIAEVRTFDDAGDVVLYNYTRMGSYPEGYSTETVIDVVFFMGDMSVGGHPVKKYKQGVWVPE
jgi:nicotinamide mononucleotide adenylyltransferase